MQVAHYLSDNLQGPNRAEAVKQVAAWLVKNGKARQVEYLSRDAAYILTGDGYVTATITTAYPLDMPTQKAVTAYLVKTCAAKDVELILVVDPNVIGGIRIETPIGTLDETVKQRLMTIVRGNNE
jgi:F-type H+-transporting ATPase subunit delta